MIMKSPNKLDIVDLVTETAPSTPAKKGKKRKATPAPTVLAPVKVRPPPPPPLEYNEENLQADRATILAEDAPVGCTQTDLVRPSMRHWNRVAWHPTPQWDEEVTDFTRHCFTCRKQNIHADRDYCAPCKRFCFVECGEYDGYMDSWRCCYCSHPTAEKEWEEFKDEFCALQNEEQVTVIGFNT